MLEISKFLELIHAYDSSIFYPQLSHLCSTEDREVTHNLLGIVWTEPHSSSASISINFWGPSAEVNRITMDPQMRLAAIL
jgi:hypothetical protein